ncbi:hypothetical protein BKA66DRAFT_534116 [Pyrenochaeta sp. MPI-SDFR-AT-0127]|nr:hypothetical protein BKA66DRAFT_534116 [Pyrenochaeta sp. MPI-SDFR-AT-0127]
MNSNHILSWNEFQSQAQRCKPAPKYNAADEPKLPHPWWDLDKEAIHMNLKNISERLVSAVNGTTGLDRELQHVMNTAANIEQAERGPPVKVALIGSQGAGKSLLINALFDCTGLSLTGAKGFACTSAIVKYAYGSGDKFSAEVQFLNAKKREEMTDEHIRSYLDYHNDLEDSDDEGHPRTRSFNQDEVDRKRKKTAEDFFDTIFGCREEFLSAWSSSPVNTGEFKNLCQVKCKEAMEQHDLNSKGVALFSKTSPKDLLEDIEPFLSNVDNTVCLWPIVDCVTIRFNHPLLQQGLEIIDLPGSGDINMSRARHADEVKDNVDVEIILCDTARIGTDEMLISTARSGVLNHGPSKVKVVATKIDVMSDDQLTHYKRDSYKQIDLLMQKADEDIAVAEEDGEDMKVLQINRYKVYLQRSKSSQVVLERKKDISQKLGATLRGLSHKESVEIIHASTADYMKWIKSGKITFDSQPALSPEDTGVPTIRRFLFNLPASQNLRDYIHHINFTVPAFVDKLNRVVTQSDRDAGFPTIADEFDKLRSKFLTNMVELLKSNYLGYVKSSIKKIRKDESKYKELLETKIINRWLTLRSPAFTRILKSRGTVPQGTSKAKGLENTVNWNVDLVSLLKPGFQNWYATHANHLNNLKLALPFALDQLYHETLAIMNVSAANLITVEKAKLKFEPLRHRMKSKMMALAEELIAEQNRLLHRATLEDERENNIIAAITNSIYDDVFMSAPELKPTPPGKPKRYVSPVFKFRKHRLEEHFLAPDDHFVDKVIQLFEDQLERNMYALIDKHFAKLNAMFDSFSKLLRDHAQIAYDIGPVGEHIRSELEKEIPYIEEKATKLSKLLPLVSKEEDELGLVAEDYLDDSDGQAQDLTYFLERITKRKRPSNEPSKSAAKRIKHEPL